MKLVPFEHDFCSVVTFQMTVYYFTYLFELQSLRKLTIFQPSLFSYQSKEKEITKVGQLSTQQIQK